MCTPPGIETLAAADQEKRAIEKIATYLCGPGKTCPHHLAEGKRIYDMAHAK